MEYVCLENTNALLRIFSHKIQWLTALHKIISNKELSATLTMPLLLLYSLGQNETHEYEKYLHGFQSALKCIKISIF